MLALSHIIANDTAMTFSGETSCFLTASVCTQCTDPRYSSSKPTGSVPKRSWSSSQSRFYVVSREGRRACYCNGLAALSEPNQTEAQAAPLFFLAYFHKSQGNLYTIPHVAPSIDICLKCWYFNQAVLLHFEWYLWRSFINLLKRLYEDYSHKKKRPLSSEQWALELSTSDWSLFSESPPRV